MFDKNLNFSTQNLDQYLTKRIQWCILYITIALLNLLVMVRNPILKVISSSKPANSYTKVRHNAVRHGVLSKSDVLPWENAKDLQSLKEGFLKDYKPQGNVEAYLIEELAVLAFRKQRLYQAEDALIVEKMQMSSPYFLKQSANLLMQEEDMDDLYETDRIDLKPILYFKPESYDGWSLEEQKHYLAKIQKVVDSDLSYEEMLTQCPKAAVEIWNQWRSNQEEAQHPDAGSLRKFLRENIIEWCQQDSKEAQARPYLKKHAIGIAYAPNDKMEKLQRYETSMDRAFERKLGMLLKLQEGRNTLVSQEKSSICLEKESFS